MSPPSRVANACYGRRKRPVKALNRVDPDSAHPVAVGGGNEVVRDDSGGSVETVGELARIGRPVGKATITGEARGNDDIARTGIRGHQLREKRDAMPRCCQDDRVNRRCLAIGQHGGHVRKLPVLELILIQRSRQGRKAGERENNCQEIFHSWEPKQCSLRSLRSQIL